MTIAKKHAQTYMPNGEVSLEQVIQAAIDEATANATLRLVAVNREVVELKEHIRQLDFVIEQHKNHAIGLHERIRQLEAERVPAEPTADMQAAGAQAIRFDTTTINKLWTANKVYRAMLAAAPAQEKVFCHKCGGSGEHALANTGITDDEGEQ